MRNSSGIGTNGGEFKKGDNSLLSNI